MFFCSLTRGITPKMCGFSFVLIISVLFQNKIKTKTNKKRPLSGQQKEDQSGRDGCVIVNSLLLISYDYNMAVFMIEKVVYNCVTHIKLL